MDIVVILDLLGMRQSNIGVFLGSFLSDVPILLLSWVPIGTTFNLSKKYNAFLCAGVELNPLVTIKKKLRIHKLLFTM